MSGTLRLLIAGDSTADGDVLEAMLTRFSPGSYQIQHAAGLSEALRMMQEHPLDVILTDLDLPGNQGLELVMGMHAHSPDVAIIAVTGRDDEKTATVAIQSGAQDYLVKGRIDADLLVRSIRYARERKRAERELQVADQRYRTIFENSAAAIMMADCQERLVSWNRFTEHLLGMGPADLLGRHISSLYPESEWKRIRAMSLREGQTPCQLETRMVRKDGRTIDVEISLSLLRDADGVITGSIGVAGDITKRKRAEDALLVKDSAINSATSGIVFADLDGRLTFANPSCLKMWGYDRETDVLGRPFASFLESRAEGAAIHRSTLETGASVADLTARREDGSTFIVQISTNLVTDKAGKPLCLMASLADITESRRIREILDRKQKNLSAIFDAAPLGMLLVNDQRSVVRANDTVRQISGKGYREMLGRHPCQALACIRAARGVESNRGSALCETCLLQRLIETTFDSGMPVHGAETRPVLSRNGRELRPWFAVSLEPVDIDGGRHVVIALNDINDRKEADEQLRETMEMKSQFISTVSHELRTPLTAMREAVTIVADGIAGKLSKDQEHFLDIARRNIDRLARLIDNVLDLQKLSAGKMKLHVQSNRMDRTIKEAYGTMLPHAQQKRLHMSLDLESNLPAVLYDNDRMIQVLTNLLSNAIKFTPEEGRIAVCARCRQEWLAVSVRDTGLGIPKDALPKIFTQFHRVHRPGKEIKGTGLGLTIVDKIMAAHGGRVEVESEVDKGTTFTILLPLEPRPSEDGMPPQADEHLENALADPTKA